MGSISPFSCLPVKLNFQAASSFGIPHFDDICAEDYQLLFEASMLMSFMQGLKNRLNCAQNQECAAFWLTFDNGPQIIYVDSFAADLILRVEHLCVYNIIIRGGWDEMDRKACVFAINVIKNLVVKPPQVLNTLHALVSGNEDLIEIPNFEINSCRYLAANCLLNENDSSFKPILKNMIAEATHHLMDTIGKSKLKINFNLEPQGIPYIFQNVKARMKESNELLLSAGIIVPQNAILPEITFLYPNKHTLAKFLNPLYYATLSTNGGSDLKDFFSEKSEDVSFAGGTEDLFRKSYLEQRAPPFIDYRDLVMHARGLLKHDAIKRTICNPLFWIVCCCGY
ncbi:hypothetical protein [Ranid herpesvirus 3]|uniref:Uncharacterized protein n=1 Tax=Ranid herpesvirus 3 TaxID=1987509 RepID=A0A1X9T585_9VIRU|nr:hypothetical protein [Ranid herpesvirus 3]ARR28862.1 hypothetical protein [Ranid herpesvirus 3]